MIGISDSSALMLTEENYARKDKISAFFSNLQSSYCVKLATITSLDLFFSSYVAKLADYGFCFNNLIPQSAFSFLNKTVRWLNYPAKKISELLNLNNKQSGALVSPVTEELQFRLLLQKGILRYLPEAIFKRYFPDLHIDFNSTKAKAIRVAISATLFALLHLQQGSCENGGGLSQFAGGVLYGIMSESLDIQTTMTLHVLYNSILEIQNSI